jgi:uncharacterized protein (TIGR02996 family)
MNTLLQVIIADPADNLARLAYADFCEEQGDVERATFIRLMIDLAKTHNECSETIGVADYPYRAVRDKLSWMVDNDSPDFVIPSWTLTEPGDWTYQVIDDHLQIRCGPPDLNDYLADFFWRGGFIDSVHTSMHLFRQYARHLFAAHPVTAVGISGMTPAGTYGRSSLPDYYCWVRQTSKEFMFDGHEFMFDGHRDKLPIDIFDLLSAPIDRGGVPMTQYRNMEAALADLEQACLIWGRNQAALDNTPEPG